MGNQIEFDPPNRAASEPGCADEILREAWRIKDDLSKRYNYDVHRIAEAARTHEPKGLTSSDQT